jgi:polyhydroxyalkanoate synthesis regulator phasin
MPRSGNRATAENVNSLLDDLSQDGTISLENVMHVIQDLARKSEERHGEVTKLLDKKCKALESKIKVLESDADDRSRLIDRLTAENLSQADLIKSIDSRLEHLKNCYVHNFVTTQAGRQRQRSWSLRVTNVSAAILGVEKVTALAIYQALFVPVYEQAVADGELTKVPSFAKLFDLCHILFTVQGTKKEVWQFCFSSRWLLHLFIRRKKETLNKLNSAELQGVTYAAATRTAKLALLRASLDMTPYNRRLIANLIDIPEVGMARVSGDHVVVCYKKEMRPGVKLSWHTIKNPLASTLAGMLEALPPLEASAAELFGDIPIALKKITININDEPEVEPRGERAKSKD